jgi:hypothetical protein
MKIISLYPSNDVYQVVSEDESSVHFQGSKEECVIYLLKDVKLKTWIKQPLTKQQEQCLNN